MQSASGSQSSSAGAAQQVNKAAALQSAEQSKSPTYQLQVHGFVVGGYVKRRKTSEEEAAIYMIESMADDVVALAPTGKFEDGPNIELTQHDLKETWKPTETKPQFRVTYYACAPEKYPDFVSKHIIGQLIAGLADLHKKAEASGFMPQDDLALYSSPNAAIATSAIPNGKLTLVPMSMNIKTRKPSEECDSKAWDLGTILGKSLGPGHEPVAYAIHPCIILAKDHKRGFTPPYWFVPEAGDGQKGNMKIHLETLVVQTPFEAVEVHVPVLKNVCKLKDGDELLLCKAKPKAQPRKKARVQ